MEVVDNCPKLHILHMQLLKWTPIYRKSTLPSICNDSRFKATISNFGSIVMKLLAIKVVKHSNYVANSYTRNQFQCMPILYIKYMQLSQILNDSSLGATVSSFGSIVMKLLTIKVVKQSKITLQTLKKKINFNLCIYFIWSICNCPEVYILHIQLLKGTPIYRKSLFLGN